jgi:hypothetical protein
LHNIFASLIFNLSNPPKERGDNMKCPKCGYKRQKRDDAFVPATDCPSCGVVYCKHDVVAIPGLPISPAGVSPPLPKSALDPGSLKKARDRVEKRLRGRLEPRPDKDERHTQTLELARKLTKRSVRKPDKREIHVPNPVKTIARPEEKKDFSESTAHQADEALLLNNAIGVQLHDDTQKRPSQTLDPEPENDPASSQGAEAGPSDGGTPDPQVADPFVLPESQQALDDLDDVQTKTVILETATAFTPETAFNPADVETTVIEHAAGIPEGIDLPPAYMGVEAPTAEVTKFGAGLRRALPIVAWMILFSGVIGAVLSWTTISNVEAGVNISTPNTSGALPLGLLLGFAYLATGALGFAFFWVSFMINRQLKEIRQLLLENPVAHSCEDPAASPPEPHEEIGG